MTGNATLASVPLPAAALAATAAAKKDRASRRLSAEELSALSVLGHVMVEHLQWDEARALFEAIVTLAPDYGYARRMLVYVHLQAGDHAQALNAAGEYRRRFDGRSVDGVLMLLESKALWGLGREAEARARLDDYLRTPSTP